MGPEARGFLRPHSRGCRGRSDCKAYERQPPFIQLLFNKPLLYTRQDVRPCQGNRERLSLRCLTSLPVPTFEDSLTKTWRLPLRNLSLGQQQNKTEFALDRRSSSGVFKIYHLYLCLCICVCVCSYLLRFLYGHSPRFSLSPSKIGSIVFFVGFSVLLFFNLVVKLSHREDSGFSQSQRIRLWQNIPPPDKSLSPFSVVPPLLLSLPPYRT